MSQNQSRGPAPHLFYNIAITIAGVPACTVNFVFGQVLVGLFVALLTIGHFLQYFLRALGIRPDVRRRGLDSGARLAQPTSRSILPGPNVANVSLTRAETQKTLYRVLLDGMVIAKIRPVEKLLFSVRPGTHTLQVRVRWTGSSIINFVVAEDSHVSFVCRLNWEGRTALDSIGASLTKDRFLDLDFAELSEDHFPG